MASPKVMDTETHAETHHAPVADVASAPGTLTQAYAQSQTDAVNAILAALRSANIIATN